MFNLIQFRFFNLFIVSVITITTILFISQNSSAADLTEFQRRQAFANEALRQGKEKFADFADIETDPFSQLAARFSDIAQSLMSMLNKVIVPFINSLAILVERLLLSCTVLSKT